MIEIPADTVKPLMEEVERVKQELASITGITKEALEEDRSRTSSHAIYAALKDAPLPPVRRPYRRSAA